MAKSRSPAGGGPPSASIVEVAGPVAATVAKAMKGKTIRGELFEVKVLKRTT